MFWYSEFKKYSCNLVIQIYFSFDGYYTQYLYCSNKFFYYFFFFFFFFLFCINFFFFYIISYKLYVNFFFFFRINLNKYYHANVLKKRPWLPKVSKTPFSLDRRTNN